ARAREMTAIDRETTSREPQRIAFGRDTVARRSVRTAFRAARRAFWNERIARHGNRPPPGTTASGGEHELCGPIYPRVRGGVGEVLTPRLLFVPERVVLTPWPPLPSGEGELKEGV